tara:strand:+ start:1606 stop:1857 length:252 start_codon:yes stop_codon:yes gene_type:complete
MTLDDDEDEGSFGGIGVERVVLGVEVDDRRFAFADTPRPDGLILTMELRKEEDAEEGSVCTPRLLRMDAKEVLLLIFIMYIWK